MTCRDQINYENSQSDFEAGHLKTELSSKNLASLGSQLTKRTPDLLHLEGKRKADIEEDARNRLELLKSKRKANADPEKTAKRMKSRSEKMTRFMSYDKTLEIVKKTCYKMNCLSKARICLFKPYL